MVGADTAASGGEDLIPRKGSTSAVWKFFGFRTDDVDQKEVICKECQRVVSVPQRNTTNLLNHLKKHKPKYDECMKTKANAGPLNPHPCPAPTQTTIMATLHRTTPYPSTS